MKLVLEELDDLVSFEPTRALREARILLRTARREEFPILLGIAGSAFRHLTQPEKARRLIESGMKMAKTLGARSSESRLYDKMVYVYGEAGQFRRALRVATLASDAALLAPSLRLLGRSMVSRGVALVCLGRFSEGLEVYSAALGLLNAEDARHAVSALNGKAKCQLETGDLEGALQSFRQCRRACEDSPPGKANLGKLSWQEGALAAQLGDLKTAEASLMQALDLLSESPLDFSIASIDYLWILLARGQVDKAMLHIQELLKFVEPLRGNRVVSAALGEVVRIRFTGSTLQSGLRRAKNLFGDGDLLRPLIPVSLPVPSRG